ncbi:MAG: LysR family transcriptional regulator, partial [Rhodospirillales bacterium]|nr:LysR family transcriptional regulator [Rhodospirillales bacterium]
MSAAADELAVTPAAVSHQIKTLEEYFGVALFHRAVRSIRLTDRGAALLPFLSEGLDLWAAGCRKLSALEDDAPLVISSAPVFAGKWLVRHLADFNAHYPDITVRLDGSLSVVDFNTDDVDAAIRFGTGPYPGLHSDALVNEDVIPVCAPELQNGAHPLLTPDDLAYHTLIHVDWYAAAGTQPDWTMWLKTAGVTGVEGSKGPVVTSDSLAVEAALNGGGVVLVSEFLVRHDLESGRLVKPFDLMLPSNHWYWFVCPPENLERPKILTFRDWLIAAIKDAERTP